MGKTEGCHLGTLSGEQVEAADVALVRLLADGSFHSGEQLGAAMGVSRAAVWKRLTRLDRIGVSVERVRGKGYRLSGGLELLAAEPLLEAGALSSESLDLQIFDSLPSTNLSALEQARSGLRRPLAVMAEYQQAGRGRRGRSWQSPYGRNISLSLASGFPGGAARLEGLSLAVGVVVADVLQGHGLAGRVSLKWPNDVLVDGRKLAGILVELSGDLDSECTAVIGIGLNGSLPDSAASRIDQPWTDLQRETGLTPQRNRLAGELIAALLLALDKFRAHGFAFFQGRWGAYDSCHGRAVDVLLADRKVSGVARGVSAQGALMLDVDGRIELFHGGEVSLRAQ